MSLTPSPCFAVVRADLVLLAQRARDDEADVALLEHVGGAVAHPVSGPAYADRREANRVLVEVRSLLGVADPELDVIPPEQRHEVNFGHAPIYAARPGSRRSLAASAAAGAARRRSPRKRSAAPPAISSPCIDSERIRKIAKSTPKNGCMLLKIEARVGADPADRREPEDVREEERPDDRVDEAEPDRPGEGTKLLAGDLRKCSQARAATQPSASTTALIRTANSAASAARSPDRVGRPGDRERDREKVSPSQPETSPPPAPAAISATPRNRRRQRSRTTGQPLEHEDENEISPAKIGAGAEDQRDVEVVRRTRGVHEAELIDADRMRGREPD